ncbi:ATP-synt_DE_N domain-containing protein [Meloidogyne graminicola]|uniref:ATP-synt_DE_N domain-containing protein n=1 Tax=Meloidogyne graminicola TaxID=189291 RepID=A0A8S9ZDS5_9BILA|nr:ATP-synt_DE_N domain-containing protein [Meloidogyne graminicola]
MASNMGILPVHVPTIAMLKPGVISVYETDGKVSKYFVSSGSLSMNIDGSCQILVEECASLDELDNTAAKQLMDEANRKALDPTATDVQKAEAGIEVEVADAVMKAAGSGGGH